MMYRPMPSAYPVLSPFTRAKRRYGMIGSEELVPIPYTDGRSYDLAEPAGHWAYRLWKRLGRSVPIPEESGFLGYKSEIGGCLDSAMRIIYRYRIIERGGDSDASSIKRFMFRYPYSTKNRNRYSTVTGWKRFAPQMHDILHARWKYREQIAVGEYREQLKFIIVYNDASYDIGCGDLDKFFSALGITEDDIYALEAEIE